MSIINGLSMNYSNRFTVMKKAELWPKWLVIWSTFIFLGLSFEITKNQIDVGIDKNVDSTYSVIHPSFRVSEQEPSFNGSWLFFFWQYFLRRYYVYLASSVCSVWWPSAGRMRRTPGLLILLFSLNLGEESRAERTIRYAQQPPILWTREFSEWMFKFFSHFDDISLLT